MQTLVDLKNVSKVFTQGKVQFNALHDVNLSIQTGEFVVLRGVSGSGKSTLLNVMGGLLPPTTGQINLLGQAFYAQPDAKQSQLRKHHIGFIFQQFYLIPTLTVFENVELPLKLLASKDAANQVNAMLEQLGLATLANHKPAELSGGQQQRVALARAMVKRPQYIVADEPTASLDASNSTMILNMLKQANQHHGNTMILTSHDPDIVQKVSPTRVITLRDGELC